MLTEHYQFGDVHVTVWPYRQYLTTTFPDGTTVDACPQPTVAYRNHALTLGYSAAWQMCRDHELAHTFLAHRNHTVSPALWAVAHGDTVDTDEIRDEEAWVLAFQQACRRKPWAEAHRIEEPCTSAPAPSSSS